jgi:hypothetical protein
MRVYCALLGFAMYSLGAQAQQVQQPLSFDFFAANAPRGWAVTAEITGTAERDGDVLKLFVKTCSLFRPERFSDPINFVSITSGISRVRPGDTWEILRRSERHMIRRSLEPGKRIDLPPFELTIPLREFAIENGDRLTFQISNVSERNGNKRGGHVPVHARVEWPDSVLMSNSTAAPGVVPFRSYADPTADRIDGEIDGRISRQPEALTLTVDSCVLSSSDEYPDDRRQIATIQVLIARTLEAAKMTIERTGEAHTVEEALKPGATIALQPFELKLSLVNYTRQPTDRISLRIVSITSDGNRETTYLHVPYQLPRGQDP